MTPSIILCKRNSGLNDSSYFFAFNVTLRRRVTDNIKAQIIKHYQRISDREAYVTAEMVRNTYQGIGTEYQTLLGAFDKDNECFKKRIGIDRAASSYKDV